MKIKTADLLGPALDWAVTVAEGLRPIMRHDYMKAKAAANNYKGDLAWHLEVTPNEPITVDETGVTHVLRLYSVQWSQGGPIIEGQGISLNLWAEFGWRAGTRTGKSPASFYSGPAPLIAAMRCYVASRLGDEVEIPEELMKISA